MARIYIANLWFEKCYFSHLRFTLFNFCNPPLLKTMANLANNWWSSMAETYPKREREGISITLHAWLIFNSPKALSCSLSFSNQACNFSFRLYFHVVVFCLFVFFFFWWCGGQFGDGREGGGGCERHHFWEIALIIGNFMCIAIVHSFLQKNSNSILLICFMLYFHIKRCFSNGSIRYRLQWSNETNLR